MTEIAYMDLYKRMVLIRTLESRLLDIANSDGSITDLHLSKGEEAVSVGACAALRKTDLSACHHRTIAHLISRGVKLQPLVDEILGRATGLNNGMAGEMHLMAPEVGFKFTFQLVGTSLATSVGMAWASRYALKNDNIVMCVIGDGSTSNAQTMEGLNEASILGVPLLVLVSDNGISGNVPQKWYVPESVGLEGKFSGFGIKNMRIDGNKIDQVVDAATMAVDYVRTQSKPFALICSTTRVSGHKIGQRSMATPEQIKEMEARDPLQYAEKLLGLTEVQITEIKTEATRKVNDAIDKAHAAPWPQPDKVLLDNYNS